MAALAEEGVDGTEDAAGFPAGTGDEVATAAEGGADVSGVEGATGVGTVEGVAEGATSRAGCGESALDPTFGFVATATIFLP